MDTISLAKAIKFTVDNRGRTVPTEGFGIKLIATNCISNDDLYPSYKKVRYVSKEIYDTWFRSHPEPLDIILTNKGSQNGAICLVPGPVDFVIAQDMVALRADDRIIDPLFLFAALRSPDVQRQIKSLDVSGVIPHFKKSDFDKLILPYPPRDVQRHIGVLYFNICAKIDVNRRINETLETMGRAIFKDWFVDFGPTRAKMEGREPYLSPGLWSLFPDRFDDDGKPYGWHRGTVGQHILNHDSKRVPVSGGERAKRRGPYPYHGATGVMDYVDDYLFDGIYLLVGEDGSVMKENGLAFTQYVWGKIWVNNHAHVLQGKQSVSTEHLVLYFQNESVAPYITGAVQLKLSQGRMNTMPFLFAGERLCQSFSKEIRPLFQNVRANSDAISTLVATRDLLLPKLMSGEIRITDAEKLLESVL